MRKRLSFGLAIGLALCVFDAAGQDAQTQNAQTRKLVQTVMSNELSADSSDHSHWIYRDDKKTPKGDIVTIVVETAAGSVKKTIAINGQPLTSAQQAQDQARIDNFVRDSSAQQKQRQKDAHDDQQARAFMKILPDAFLWTQAEQSDDTVTLNFKPNPEFKPPSREARVFAAMAGKMVVDRKQQRLRSLSGTLIAPVDFGWGLLGKLQKGGTFRMERQEVAPNEWQTIALHVHIRGKALLFKSIDEQQDEETSNYKAAPDSLSLAQAAAMLKSGDIEKKLGEKQ